MRGEDYYWLVVGGADGEDVPGVGGDYQGGEEVELVGTLDDVAGADGTDPFGRYRSLRAGLERRCRRGRFFDAHPDLYDEFEGSRVSHACPFARIMEERLAKRLVQLGIRTMNGHQREQAARFGVQVVEMRSLPAYKRLEIHGPVYVSFDMDVLARIRARYLTPRVWRDDGARSDCSSACD